MISIGCSDNEESITYPVEVDIEDFSLDGTLWQNLVPDNVYLINSREELAPYISGVVDIDFDKYSLIIASGEMPSGIDSIATNLSQTSSDEYRLEIDIKLNPAANIIIEPWTASLLAPKIKENAAVGLVLNYNYSNQDDDDDDNAKYILGKWEVIAEGYYDFENEIVMSPVEPNGSYKEFLNNGKIRDHIVYPEEIRDTELDGTYELDAEFLYIYFNREIYGTESDQIYKYSIDSDKDELRLEIIQGMIPAVFGYPVIKVYKRIK
jgi:hypothetical protein